MPHPPLRKIAATLAGLFLLLAAGWFVWQKSALAPGRAVSAAPSRPLEKIRHRSPGLAMAANHSRAMAEEQAQALDRLLAGLPFVLVEDGQPRRFLLALDEVYLPLAPAGERIRKIERQPDAIHVLAAGQQVAGQAAPGWVIYPEGREAHPAQRRVIHSKVLVRAAGDPVEAKMAISRAGLQVLNEPDYAPGYIIASAGDAGPRAALAAVTELSRTKSVASAVPLLLRQHQKKLLPNDPLFAQQWHLRNTGQGGGKAGTDVNAAPVWDTHQGDGVRIAVVDDGVDLAHPDLSANADTANHYDWNDTPPDTNPAPNPSRDDDHGTAVAGVAAARGGNSLGVSGVAPRASIVGFRLISDLTSDDQDADAMARGSDVIAIKNNSWGSPDGQPWIIGSVGPLLEAARKNAAQTGRGGLGTVFVWAAGNGRDYGDQGNKDGAANSIYSMAAGAIANTGKLTFYSETGAHLTAVAPTSGGSKQVVTTDLRGNNGFNDGTSTTELPERDYSNAFGGTSASSPALAGVAALILHANPNLGWRDVKEIILRSSTQIFPTETGWVKRTGGDAATLPQIKHHHSYGGGLVNAQAAVQLAQSWTNLGTPVQVTRSQSYTGGNLAIPDNNATGVTIPLDFSGISPMRVDNVEIVVNIYHDYRGDLDISLRSPAGVVSQLATKEGNDDGYDYNSWLFSSVRHWGESAAGIWSVTVKDLAKEDTGRVRSISVTLHGVAASSAQITSQPTEAQIVSEGGPFDLIATTSGYGAVAWQWKRDAAVVSTSNHYSVGTAAMSHAGTYRFTATNLTGTDTGTDVPLAVVRRAVAAQTVNEGTTATFAVVSAGAGRSFQWLHDGMPLANDSRITGAQSDKLTVKSTTAADHGLYVCRVGLAGTADTLDTLPAALTVRLKPTVTGPALATGIVSGPVDYLFSADQGATRFTAAGLPPGLTFSTPTGRLTGRPTAPGTYKVKITATNGAGTGTAWEATWIVQPFPTEAVGTFCGLVERDPLNNDLGGMIKAVVAKTGALSGTLAMAGKSYSLTGKIDAVPGPANPTAHLEITRPKPLSKLIVDFTIDLGTGQLDGTADDLSEAADFQAQRLHWSSTVKATDFAGPYTAVLEAAPGVRADPAYPQGHGYLTLTISLTGTATWAGKLADGTTITGGTTLSEIGGAPLHLNLYTSTGSAQGWATINPATTFLDGEWDWLKQAQPAKSTTRSYKGGFPLHELAVVGSRYIKPPAKTRVIGLGPVSGALPNGRLTFTGGGLAGEVAQTFQVSDANAVKMPPVPGNPNSVSLTIAATTGLISGAFTQKDADPTDVTPPIATLTRTANFNGILVNRPGYNMGLGHFLLPELPSLGPPKVTAAQTAIQSGGVRFGPEPVTP